MKCPIRFTVRQFNMYRLINDIDNDFKGDYRVLIENQDFEECYQENCVAWDKDKKMCRKLEGE